MSDPLWLATARTLAAGRRTRIECCSQDRSMLVSNEAKGYRAYCFRCGPAGFVAHGEFSIDALRRRREEFNLTQSAQVYLPKDFSTDIPPSEAVWLYRAGIGADIAKHYGFGYSATLRRVVLPVYRGGTLLGFTARSTINEKPKYIERLSEDAVFFSDPAAALPREDAAGPGVDCVITEDILSAVRVGRCVRRASSLLGTSANATQIDTVLSACGPTEEGHRLTFCLWLDPDRAGRTANRKIARSLSLMGHTVREVRTARDPKFYSNREIKEILEGD